MNDIDRYLDQACRQVNGPDSLRAHLRKELKEHLEEAIDALVAEGMSASDATAKAIEDLGDPEIIRDGMESVYSPGVTSLFVDKAIKWRDRKWHIAAQMGLGLIIASAIGSAMSMMIFVTPVLVVMHEHVGLDVPAVMIATIGLSNMVWKYYWIGLLLLIGGWGLFEWKCRSENKAHIRTATGVGLALLSVLAALWVMVAIGVSFALLGKAAPPRKPIPISQTPVQYGDHYYQVFHRDEGIEWNDAKTQCESLGGYLVIINDAGENAFLTSIGAGNSSFHLGASDAESEGDWRWVDGSPLTYQNWDKGEPTDGRTENYLRAFSAQWPQWSSERSRAKGFLCEWDRLPESNGVQ